MLIITTWCWGDAFGDHYVRRLAAGVHRNLNEGHRFICFTDRKRHLPAGVEQVPIKREDYQLLGIKGCFARLRLFDPHFQHEFGVRAGDRLVSLDLDLVVTGELDPVFARDRAMGGFKILQGINTTNPCPYNGSVWMYRGGHPDVWTDFSLENYAKLGVPFHSFPDDQGWFQYKMPDSVAWGPADGVYGFKKKGWPSGESLPEGARLVAFPGWRDPSKFEHLDWVREAWRD